MRTYEYDPNTEFAGVFVCPEYVMSGTAGPNEACQGMDVLQTAATQAEFACGRDECPLIGKLAAAAAAREAAA